AVRGLAVTKEEAIEIARAYAKRHGLATLGHIEYANWIDSTWNLPHPSSFPPVDADGGYWAIGLLYPCFEPNVDYSGIVSHDILVHPVTGKAYGPHRRKRLISRVGCSARLLVPTLCAGTLLYAQFFVR